MCIAYLLPSRIPEFSGQMQNFKTYVNIQNLPANLITIRLLILKNAAKSDHS